MDDDLLSDKPMAPKQIATIQAYPQNPGDDSDLLGPSTVANSQTGQTQEPLPQWQSGFKSLSDRLAIGGANVSRGIAGLSTVFGRKFEDAQKDVESASLLKAQMDTEDYVNTHGYWDFYKMKYQPPKGPAPYAVPGDYHTNLSAADETKFQDWVKKNNVPFQDGPKSDYDMRGFWKGLTNGDPHAKQEVSNFDGHMHFSDWWKTPYHESFSADSQWATKDAPHWQGSDKEGWVLKMKDGTIVKDERLGGKPPDANGFKISSADLPGWLTEQIPQMGLTGVGAATGAGVGAIFGGLPGAAIGGAVGGYLPNAYLAAGNHIYDLQSRGVDKHTATVAGSVVGAVTGTLEMVGLGKLLGAAPDAAIAVMKSKTFVEGFKHVLGTLLHSVATEVSTEHLESLAESTSKIITAKLNNKVQPITSAEVLDDAIQSIVKSAVVATQFSTATTGTGLHAGLVARAIQEKMDAATHLEQQMQAQELLDQQAQQRAQQEHQAAQVEQNTTAGQAKARKQLKGFVEVRDNIDVHDAHQALADAREHLDNSTADDKPVAKLAVKQAEAELKHAQLQAQVGVIEDALTDPELLKTVKERKANLQGRIDQMQQMIEDANHDAETEPGELKKLKKRLTVMKEAMKEVTDLENLGSEEKVKEEVTKRKEKVVNHAAEARHEVAQAALERRLAERGKTVAQLKAEIRADKKEARDIGGEADTAARRARLEQLNEQQQIDSLLLQMFAEKQVTADDVSNLSAKVPAARLTGLVKVAGKQIEAAAKVAGKEQKKFTASAKRLLDGVIELARIPKADKDAFSAALLAQDLKAISEALPKLEAAIKEQFDARRLEAAHADLETQLHRIKVKKGEISKVPGTEELLSSIREFAQDPEAITRFEMNLEDKNELTDLEEQQMELINLFPVPVKEMTASQIEKIIDAVVELRETGKAEALRRLEERKARQAKKLATFKQLVEPTDRGQKRLDAAHRTITKLLDDVVNSPSNSWRGLMTIVSQFGKMSDMADILDIKTALSHAHDVRLTWEARLQEIAKEKGVTASAWHKMLLVGHKRGEKLQYVKAEADLKTKTIRDKVYTLENEDGKPLSHWEMIQVRNYLLDSDPDAISRLSQGNRFSYPGEVEKGGSTLEQIEGYLNTALPGWRPAADALRQFYNEFHAVVDEASFRRFGRHVPKNDTYGGELLSSTQPGGRFKERFRRLTTRPRSLQDRQGGTRAVDIRSAIDNVNNHIAQYAREVSLLEFEQDAQHIFKDTEVRKFIQRTIGKNTLQAIDLHIEDIVLGYNKSHTIVDKVFTWLRDSLYTHFLAGRPEQFAKQATSIVYALQFVGPKAMIEGYEYMLANPKKAIELMNKSGLYRARLQDQANIKAGFANDLKRFNGSMMHAVKAGDIFGVQGAAFPVLLKVLKETGSEKKALAAFETVFDTTQSSGSIDEQPLIFRANPMIKIFTALAQQPTRNGEDIVTAFRGYRSSGKASDFHHFLRTVGVMYTGAFLYQAMGYVLMYPFMSDDEREKKLNFILDVSCLGPFSGVAVVGNLLSFMWVSSMKVAFNQNTRAFEPELLPTNPFGALALFYTKLLKLGSEGGDTESYWSAIMAASREIGQVTGLPTTNILKQTEPFIGVKK